MINSQKGIHFLSAVEADVYVNVYDLDLYYRLEGARLRIHFSGTRNFVQTYSYDPDKIPLKERLREIIFDSMRFIWYREFQASPLFSREEFEELMERHEKEKNEARARAAKLHAGRESVRLCEQAQLDPMHEGGHPGNWVANCIAAPGHRMHFNPVTGDWGCGYCKIKGDLEELKQRLAGKERQREKEKMARLREKYPLIEKFFHDQEEYIDFLVRLKELTKAGEDGKCFAELKKEGNSYLYKLIWLENGRYVGDYVKPFRASRENLEQFHQGTRIIADRLRIYLETNDPAKVPHDPPPFGTLTREKDQVKFSNSRIQKTEQRNEPQPRSDTQ